MNEWNWSIICTKLADQVGGQILQSKNGRIEGALLQRKQWTILLATYPFSTRSSYSNRRFTLIRASYFSKDGFRFRVSRRGLFSRYRPGLIGLARPIVPAILSSMREMETGYPELDREFTIKGNDESKVRGVFANANIRQLIRSQPYMNLQLTGLIDTIAMKLTGPDPYSHPKTSPQGVGLFRYREVYYDEPELITDVRRLKSLFELFGETLDQLYHIGSAG